MPIDRGTEYSSGESKLIQLHRQLSHLLGTFETWTLYLFVSGLSLSLLLFPSLTTPLDARFFDFVQGKTSPYLNPDPSLLVIGIDQETLDAVPFRWPWPRAELARLVRNLAAGKPKLLILDMLLQHPESASETVSPGDAQLRGALQESGNVALVGLLEETHRPGGRESAYSGNHELFRSAAALEGFVWGWVDTDGLIRSFVYQDPRRDCDGAAFQVAKKINPALSSLPLNERGLGEGILSFPEGNGGIPVLSALPFLKAEVPPESTRGKILILGATANVLHDFHLTPKGLMTGPELLAVSLDTLLGNRVILRKSSLPWRFFFTLVGFWGGIWAVFHFSENPLKFSVTFFLSGLGIFSLVGWFFQWFLPLGTFFANWMIGTVFCFGIRHFVLFVSNQVQKTEAEAARTVQQQFFPKSTWTSPQGYSCRGLCKPADEVGGDYYNFVPLPNGSLFFVLGDVAGHGLPAALITTMAKATINTLKDQSTLGPEVFFDTFNSLLVELFAKKDGRKINKFMTCVGGLLWPAEDRFSVHFAGHLPGYIIRNDREVQEIGSASIPLGLRSSNKTPKPQFQFSLFPGESLLFFTDGIVEATNFAGEQYGFKRWSRHVSEVLPTFRSESSLDDILKDLLLFTEGKPLADDVTLLLIQRTKEGTT